VKNPYHISYKSVLELQHLAIILLELAKIDFVTSDVAVEYKAEKQEAGLRGLSRNFTAQEFGCTPNTPKPSS
jgi:hypothetical protein